MRHNRASGLPLRTCDAVSDARYMLVIQVYWQGMIRLSLMGQMMIYDYQLKQQLNLLFNYLA